MSMLIGPSSAFDAMADLIQTTSDPLAPTDGFATESPRETSARAELRDEIDSELQRQGQLAQEIKQADKKADTAKLVNVLRGELATPHPGQAADPATMKEAEALYTRLSMYPDGFGETALPSTPAPVFQEALDFIKGEEAAPLSDADIAEINKMLGGELAEPAAPEQSHEAKVFLRQFFGDSFQTGAANQPSALQKPGTELAPEKQQMPGQAMRPPVELFGHTDGRHLSAPERALLHSISPEQRTQLMQLPPDERKALLSMRTDHRELYLQMGPADRAVFANLKTPERTIFAALPPDQKAFVKQLEPEYRTFYLQARPDVRALMEKADPQAMKVLQTINPESAEKFLKLPKAEQQVVAKLPPELRALYVNASPEARAQLQKLDAADRKLLAEVPPQLAEKVLALPKPERKLLSQLPPDLKAMYLEAQPDTRALMAKMDPQDLKQLEVIHPDHREAYLSLPKAQREVLAKLSDADKAKFLEMPKEDREKLRALPAAQQQQALSKLPEAKRSELSQLRELQGAFIRATPTGEQRIAQAASKKQIETASNLGKEMLAFFGVDSKKSPGLQERATALANNFLQGARGNTEQAKMETLRSLLETPEFANPLMAEVKRSLEQAGANPGSSVTGAKMIERFAKMQGALPAFAQEILHPDVTREELVASMSQAVEASAEFESARAPRRRRARAATAFNGRFIAG